MASASPPRRRAMTGDVVQHSDRRHLHELQRSAVFRMARKSMMHGWHGTSTEVGTSGGSSDAASEWGAVSIIRTPVAMSRAWATTLANRAGWTEFDVRHGVFAGRRATRPPMPEGPGRVPGRSRRPAKRRQQGEEPAWFSHTRLFGSQARPFA